MFDVRIFSLKTNILLCKVFTTHLWSAVKTQIHIPSKRYMAIQSTLHPKKIIYVCIILPSEKKWNVRENIGDSCKIAGKGQHLFFWKRQWIDCCCVKMIIVFFVLWWFFFVCGLSIMRPLCCKFHIFFGLLRRERELCRIVSRACFQKYSAILQSQVNVITRNFRKKIKNTTTARKEILIASKELWRKNVCLSVEYLAHLTARTQ